MPVNPLIEDYGAFLILRHNTVSRAFSRNGTIVLVLANRLSKKLQNP